MISVCYITLSKWRHTLCGSGIGKETARLLSFGGGKIILACRDMEKAQKVRGEYTDYRKI